MTTRSLSLPRLPGLAANKSAVLSVLDIGTSKAVCLIARVAPIGRIEAPLNRTHRCRLLGIGHARMRGVKAGVVTDLDGVELAIRQAVDAAERMAGAQVESVIVNLTGGRLGAHRCEAHADLQGRAVDEADLRLALGEAACVSERDGRIALHAIPAGFHLDSMSGVLDPRGMAGDRLWAELNVVDCETPALRNLMLAVERCHLDVDAVVASPYAAGLSALVDDEAEMGAAVIDMGAGTTSIGVFLRGRLVHAEAFAVGGNHVTMDIARGLTLRLVDAERLKTLYGACQSSPADEREMLSVNHAGEDPDKRSLLPKPALAKIIRPRIEEILELTRDRLAAMGHVGRRVVLTGGTSQLIGIVPLARQTISPHVRLGRPLGVQGLPDAAKSPAFAVSAGLLIYPQTAGSEHFSPVRQPVAREGTRATYAARVGRWLRDSF